MKTIGILTDLRAENPETVCSDSEEAVFHLSSYLEKRGHRVIVSTNPSVVDVALIFDPEQVERLEQTAKKIYLWPQGLCRQSYSASSLSQLAGVLWLTDWQRQHWSTWNPILSRFTTLFGYGVEPKEFGFIRPRDNPHSCVYASEDARGLEILLRHWAYLKMNYPKATLDLYYGEGHWDTVTPREQDAIRAKLARLKSFDVKERGQRTRQEIHRALEMSSMWTYPCTAPAPSCMLGLKAQFAGAIPVAIVPRPSAYAEILRVGAFSEIEQNYYDILARIFSKIPEVPLSTRQQMGDFVHREFTWEKLTNRLEELIQ